MLFVASTTTEFSTSTETSTEKVCTEDDVPLEEAYTVEQ